MHLKKGFGVFFNTNLVFEGAKDQKTYIKKKCLYSLFNVNRWSWGRIYTEIQGKLGKHKLN